MDIIAIIKVKVAIFAIIPFLNYFSHLYPLYLDSSQCLSQELLGRPKKGINSDESSLLIDKEEGEFGRNIYNLFGIINLHSILTRKNPFSQQSNQEMPAKREQERASELKLKKLSETNARLGRQLDMERIPISEASQE